MKTLSSKRKKILKILIGIIIFSTFIILIIPTFLINFFHKDEMSNYNLKVYNAKDLYNMMANAQECSIELGNITYEDNITVNIYLNSPRTNSIYSVEIKKEDNVIEKQELNNQDNSFAIPVIEGKNDISCYVYRDNELVLSKEEIVYKIEKYQKQFLDELSNKGIGVHYRDGTWEDYDKSKDFLKALGVNYIRTDFMQWSIDKNENWDFSKYDSWINDLEATSNIKILPILTGLTGSYGSDKLVNSDEEIETFVEFFLQVKEHYPNIQYYEIMNELNLYDPTYKGAYFNEEDMQWYSKLMKRLEEESNGATVIVAGTCMPDKDTETRITSDKFYNMFNNTKGTWYSNNYAIHPYSINNLTILREKVDSHVNLFNEFGGFNNIYITEYGSTVNYVDEITQAEDLVKQTVILDETSDLSILYNLWTTGDSNSYEQFGLLTKDYKPRPSYYVMKNYYEKTNGAEYIGQVNLANGIEAHVYDKDGKSRIVAWAQDSNAEVNIPYNDFTASDMYGDVIENSNINLTITDSPVYLDNVSRTYFSKAISNTALEKYAEFEEKFTTELASIDGIDEKIDGLKQYMMSIATIETETQETAIQKMSEHFTLGNTILNAYKNGTLDIEYVKLSSMLDMLNDIGDSYEDLLTVSATSRTPYLTATEELIQSAENTINNNADLEIVYPSKILDFSKDLHKKSQYINNLEEKNDIKTGLIVSNSLHAYYLADWANEFAQIYVDDYVKENLVTLTYSNTDEFTNQDVTVTLNIGTDSKVTNNEGKNTYIFTQNDDFTFEYTRRGQVCTMTATVSNIDKDAPSISSVISGKIYLDTVKPVITDDNIQSIVVLFNDEAIQYETGMQFSSEGIYNITATDKAGNETKVEFYIVENITEDYVIKNNYILNVRQKTTLEEFKNKFNISEEYDIIRNDTRLTDNALIATGDMLRLDNGESYTIVVAGDINGDGIVANYDLSALRRYILRIRDFNELESLAADINIDGRALGVKDYTRMRIEILGSY